MWEGTLNEDEPLQDKSCHVMKSARHTKTTVQANNLKR